MKKILVVDDSRDDQELIKKSLKKKDYDLTYAERSSEVIRKVSGVFFDCILLDVTLEIENGFDLGRMLREALPNTAIIMMSGEPHKFKHAPQGLFDDCIAKGPCNNDLDMVIDNAIYQRTMPHEIRLARMNMLRKLYSYKWLISDFYRQSQRSEYGEVEKMTGTWLDDGIETSWNTYFLTSLSDQQPSVYKKRRIKFAVSTQKGCAGRCSFCWYGKQNEFIRNLTEGEILCQVLHCTDSFLARGVFEQPRLLTPVVNYAGEGEPGKNVKNVMGASRRLINDAEELGFEFIFTSNGFPSALRQMREYPDVLERMIQHWSLNSAIPEVRAEIMKATAGVSLEETLDEYHALYDLSGNKMKVSKVNLPGKTDNDEEFKATIRLLKGKEKWTRLNLKSFAGPKDFQPYIATKNNELNILKKRYENEGFEADVAVVIGGECWMGCGTNASNRFAKRFQI